MRVIIFNTLYHPYFVGGAERSAQRIAEGLTAKGYQVLVITLGPHGERDTAVVNGVEVQRLPIPNVFWPFPPSPRPAAAKALWHGIDSYNPIGLKHMTELAQRFKPDIIQTHNITGFSPSVWKIASRVFVPQLHVLHDYHLLCPSSAMAKAGVSCTSQCNSCRILRTPHRLLSARVNAVIGVSKCVLDTHLQARMFPNARIRTVINNGFSAPPGVGVVRTLRKGPLRVGYLGQISPVKGLVTLLDAVRSISAGKMMLEVAGSGTEEYVSFLKRNYRLSNVRFVGKVHASPFLNGVDCLCVPSVWRDPLPTVVLEAYAHGVPVIGARSGGITEMIDDGMTGILFEAGNVAALAKTLEWLADSSTEVGVMSRRAIEKSDEFTVEKNISKYITLHDDLVSQLRPLP